VDALLAARPDWAIAQGVIPSRFVTQLQRAQAGNGEAELRARIDVADMSFVAGAFVTAAEHAQHVLATAPFADRAARIAVTALARAGRQQEAAELVRRLQRAAR
jgi:hypothetical protein